MWHCHQGRSFRSCPTGARTSGRSAASTGCCAPMARLTGEVVPGLIKSQGRYRVWGCRTEPGVELGHHQPADQRAWRLVVPLSGDRRLEPEGRGLGCCRTGGSNHRRRSGRQGLHPRADQQGPQAAAVPHCRQRQRHTCGHAGSQVGGAGSPGSFSRPKVSNDNPYSESLFRTAKYRPDYPRRPFASAEEACLWVASFNDWYNHRHRHSGIKIVTPQPQRSGRSVLPAPYCRLRAGASATSASLVRLHSLVGSTGRSLDEPASSRNRYQSSYVDVGCLKGSRGDIFPGSYRVRPNKARSLTLLTMQCSNPPN